MERTGIHCGDQDIREAAAEGGQLPEIEVTARVMERVRELDQRRGRGSMGWAGTTAATSGLLFLVLLIAATAYAATEYIQIRNKAGMVKVQHIDPKTMPQSESSYNQYEWKLMNYAKPGERIAYYIRGKTAAEGRGSELLFTYKEQRLTDYSAFVQQLKLKDSPVTLPETAGEYTFKYGRVNPLSESKAEQDENPVYRQTLSELKGQASKDASRNLFMKVVPWTRTGFVNAEYTQQGAIVGISATVLNGGNVQVYQEPDNTPQKLKVSGREVIYNNVVRPEVSYHYLTWYNEGQDVYYMLTTYGDHVLPKEELLKLAGELMQGGL